MKFSIKEFFLKCDQIRSFLCLKIINFLKVSSQWFQQKLNDFKDAVVCIFPYSVHTDPASPMTLFWYLADFDQITNIALMYPLFNLIDWVHKHCSDVSFVHFDRLCTREYIDYPAFFSSLHKEIYRKFIENL